MTDTNAPPIVAKDVSLQWDASPSPEVTGYRLYWGTNSGAYDNMSDTGTNLTATVSNLTGTTYFAVTAVSDDGESVASNEVSK